MEKVVLYVDRDGYLHCDLANHAFTPRPSWQWWALYETPTVSAEDVSMHPGRNDWTRSKGRLAVDWDTAVKLSDSRTK